MGRIAMCQVRSPRTLLIAKSPRGSSKPDIEALLILGTEQNPELILKEWRDLRKLVESMDSRLVESDLALSKGELESLEEPERENAEGKTNRLA